MACMMFCRLLRTAREQLASAVCFLQQQRVYRRRRITRRVPLMTNCHSFRLVCLRHAYSTAFETSVINLQGVGKVFTLEAAAGHDRRVFVGSRLSKNTAWCHECCTLAASRNAAVG